MLTVEALRALLELTPHPVEGGYFVETYRSAEQVAADALPSRYAGARAAGGDAPALAPGFDYTDHETARRADLLATHPTARNLIAALTH
jgi:predicted cupin superfamily sugar epimerase